MIDKDTKNKIIQIWDQYNSANRKVLNTKGKEIPNIDELREEAIKDLVEIIHQFQKGESNLSEFKTSIDSYNKRNNLWGFTAIKGQMFFNQLMKYEDDIEKLTKLLKDLISEPKNLNEALSKIEKFEKYTSDKYAKAPDKRKVANPGSTGYFLSYFWQLQNPDRWPIFYTSLANSFMEIGIWEDQPTQKGNYEHFFQLNEEIKEILSKHTKKPISNWDTEHAFWSYSRNAETLTKEKADTQIEITQEEQVSLKPSFNLTDYLIPKVAKLGEYGAQTDISSSAKGSQFEKLVGDVFKLLDFEVELLGQGKGRNPDLIIKFREDHTAFIVDAKAHKNDYGLGLDDRAIREYINYHCPKLIKGGFRKIGFIIVSNSFKPDFDTFINEITWETDIKRFILLTSEALLYLLAYKTKDQLSSSRIIESLIGFGNPVTAQDIIQEFDDV